MYLCFSSHSTAWVTESNRKWKLCHVLLTLMLFWTCFLLLQNTKWKSMGSKPQLDPTDFKYMDKQKIHFKLLYCLLQSRKEVIQVWNAMRVNNFNIWVNYLFNFSIFCIYMIVTHVVERVLKQRFIVDFMFKCTTCCGLLRERH